MTTTNLHITKLEDHEGFGRCGHCGREGLRWIAVLSDGTSCGTECAKRVLGYAIKPTSYSWLNDFSLVAEHATKFETFTLYRSNKGASTRLAINGKLYCNGNGAAEFARLTGIVA